MNDEITEFPEEVIEQMGYYVYRLIDPRNGETFYVGRGQGNRVFQHIKETQYIRNESYLTDKLQTINDIQKSGLKVIHVIHRHGLTEAQVGVVEAALIDAYPNATNIQGGFLSNDFGPMNVKEIITKYKAETAEILHNVLMISIRSDSHHNLYDQTRFAWRLSKTKIKKIEYVLPVIKGIIRGVYIADEWKEATIDNFPKFELDVPERMAFSGKEASDDIKELYIGKKLPDKYRHQKGASNPIRYSF